jgi:ABC-type uncharacterized transport system fused permease/ATPase subunit
MEQNSFSRVVGITRENAMPSDTSAAATGVQETNEPREGIATEGAAIRSFARMSLTYWRGPISRRAWLYVLAIAATMAVTLGVNLAYNFWNKLFFDALGLKQPSMLWSSLLWLPIITVAGAGLAAVMVYLKMSLQADWRRFVSERLLSLWLGDQRYYRLSMSSPDMSSVEQRIAEDVRLVTDPVVDLSIGLVWSVSSALTFIGVLIWVGGSLQLSPSILGPRSSHLRGCGLGRRIVDRQKTLSRDRGQKRSRSSIPLRNDPNPGKR